MPSVTLVRHGQSEANATENHAIYDPGITDLGRKQAAQIHGHFNLVIISTLRRTKETLEHSQVTYDKLLILDEAREIKDDVNSCLLHDEERIIETPADMARRMLRFKERLRELVREYERILVVCHYGTIWHLTGSNAHEIIDEGCDVREPNGIVPDNCQMVELEL